MNACSHVHYLAQPLQEIRRRADDLARTRAEQRKRRMGAGLPVVALVGYTNAGKSSLMQRLTDAGLVQDEAFATLDPLVRRLVLPSGRVRGVAGWLGLVGRSCPGK